MNDPVQLVVEQGKPIAVYGTGYVGLSLIAVYLRKKMNVIGVDINEKRLKDIEEGNIRIVEKEILDAVSRGLKENKLILTNDGVKASVDSVVKVVTVPVNFVWDLREVRYDWLRNVSRTIGLGLKKYDLVVIESSVPPGTTETIVRPILEETSGLKAGEDFYLAYSPERIYVGRAVKDIEENYPKVVAGINKKSLDAVSRFYRIFCKKGIVEMSSIRAAEFEKLAEGIYRDVNIALANELALLAMKLGIDYYEVRKAANSQPYCNLHLPGSGVGGYCIPLYPYFVMKTPVLGEVHLDLVTTARRINEGMPFEVVKLALSKCLEHGIDLSSIKVAILGGAFRGDIDDTRLSPTHEIVGILKARGVRRIVVHDPYIETDPVLKKLNVPLTNNLSKALENAMLVLIVTRHTLYKGLRISDILSLTKNKPIIVDAVSVLKRDISYQDLVILGVSSI